MPTKPTLINLRKQNRRYHNTIPNKLRKPTLLKRALAKRDSYLAALEQKPFFRDLFANRLDFFINVGGKPTRFTLLQSGTGGINMHLLDYKGTSKQPLRKYSFAFVLDLHRRIRFFCAPAKGGKTNSWTEVRGMQAGKGLKNYVVTKEKGHTESEYREAKELSAMISSHERNIKFRPDWRVKELLRVLKYL